MPLNHEKKVKIKIYSDIYPTRCNITQFILFISGTCTTCFEWYLHPSSGAHTTVSTAAGPCQTVIATCRNCGRVGTEFQLFHDTTRNKQSSFQKQINCVTLHLVAYVSEYKIVTDLGMNVKSLENIPSYFSGHVINHNVADAQTFEGGHTLAPVT